MCLVPESFILVPEIYKMSLKWSFRQYLVRDMLMWLMEMHISNGIYIFCQHQHISNGDIDERTIVETLYKFQGLK
jgi:hypothetical protein